MSKEKGLGRGLSALIDNTNNSTDSQIPGVAPRSTSEKIYQVLPISQIEANPNQPRTSFNDETIRELADSIREVGVVQPVLVRRAGGRYELVAGERRLRAARMAGINNIPALVREADDGESLELALIENINREDLNPIDTARAYASLQEDFGLTQEMVAKKVGRSRPAIANTLRLLELPGEVQELVEAGRLSEGHGRALLSVPDRAIQKQLASRIVSRGMSVRQAEKLVKREAAGTRINPEPLMAPVDQETLDEATDAVYSAFRLPAKVRWTAKGGRIEIEFNSREQLLQVLEKLGLQR